MSKRSSPASVRTAKESSRRVNVAIVGAGPAGLGTARVLRDLGVPEVRIFERRQIGASFQAWPEGMRFISPSFPANAFGLTDLNAISFDSSPAFALGREHPSGAEYATYLKRSAEVFGLSVVTGVDVREIEPDDANIILHTNSGRIRARFVIWAAGQFQYPRYGGLAGAEHGLHSSGIKRWSEHPGKDVIVVGGYESGIDAAIGLATAGKSVTVLSRSPAWETNDADPSVALSPYTRQRLDTALRRTSITLVGDADILGLEQMNGSVRVLAADGRSWGSSSKPILATGFAGSTGLIDEWLAFDDGGSPILTPQDESTELPGLFLVGPELKHSGHLFCYIYKFRQRFAVVARTIAARLGADTSPLDVYRANNMLLDDLSCCDADNCLC
ncbi:NAD(P)/FAD-dependent oxidoreductase (plasmid) [Nitrobacteraceae bacterium UC4446_H13]